jgi:hypothetical protein
MKIILFAVLVPLLVACTKFDTAKPTVSIVRTGQNDEDVRAIVDCTNLPLKKVLFYGVQLDTIVNAPINSFGEDGLPGPSSFQKVFFAASNDVILTPGRQYYITAFVALKSGELVLSEPLEFTY